MAKNFLIICFYMHKQGWPKGGYGQNPPSAEDLAKIPPLTWKNLRAKNEKKWDPPCFFDFLGKILGVYWAFWAPSGHFGHLLKILGFLGVFAGRLGIHARRLGVYGHIGRAFGRLLGVKKNFLSHTPPCKSSGKSAILPPPYPSPLSATLWPSLVYDNLCNVGIGQHLM